MSNRIDWLSVKFCANLISLRAHWLDWSNHTKRWQLAPLFVSSLSSRHLRHISLRSHCFWSEKLVIAVYFTNVCFQKIGKFGIVSCQTWQSELSKSDWVFLSLPLFAFVVLPLSTFPDRMSISNGLIHSVSIELYSQIEYLYFILHLARQIFEYLMI